MKLLIKLKAFLILFLLLFTTLTSLSQNNSNELVDYVDNFIGVRDANSSTVIGPQLPNAGINPSPQTPGGDNKYDMDCYNINQPIRGFGQLHVSGSGWGKYGQIFLSPQVGLAVGETEHDSPKENEKATAYEYGVTLSRYKIKTEVTPATHSAIYRFTFPKTDKANILLDVSHQLGDIATGMPEKYVHFIDGEVQFSSKDGDELKGYGIYTGGFSDGNYKIYYCARLSKKPASIGTWYNGAISEGSLLQKAQKKMDRIGAYVNYSTKENEEIYLKIAISFKSVEQATLYLDLEIPEWDYNQIKQQARNKWNHELSKLVVEGGTESEKRIFYTAAYHASFQPRNKTNDTNIFGKDVPVWDDHLAVWDTWRTLYPLKVLTNPSMVSGTINSFIARQKLNGRVKDAYVALTDKDDDQGGDNITNIIVDAYVKGIEGVDWKEAYKLVKYQADNDRKGIMYGNKVDSSAMYKKLGWIPAGKMSCSVSLEYAYNDFCAALMAKDLGTKADYKKYLSRSAQWVNLWNPEANSDGFKGFIVPKKLDGSFVPIDIKKEWGSWKDYFYEGNSWTYSYFMPHQFEKLVTLSGGKDKFAEKLQYAFTNNLINYGNEPAFLAVQSFHYADRTDLVSYYVRKLMKERFSEDGCIENEDSGAMSSWYIFSCMGFFPNSGQNLYYLTGPTFPKITLELENGQKLTILANNLSPENIYIQSVKINSKSWQKPYFTHDMIKNGGSIEFVMGEKPVKKI
jgi:predicted alpha-1,2-mannosidase